EARVGTPDDVGYPLSIFERGDTFGEMALLTDEPRSTTVSALTDLRAWSLPKERFRRLVQSTPELAVALGRLLARRLQATNQAVSSMHVAFDRAAEREFQELAPDIQGFLNKTSPLDPIPVSLAE